MVLEPTWLRNHAAHSNDTFLYETVWGRRARLDFPSARAGVLAIFAFCVFFNVIGRKGAAKLATGGVPKTELQT